MFTVMVFVARKTTFSANPLWNPGALKVSV
jgi:hypothetical protein